MSVAVTNAGFISVCAGRVISNIINKRLIQTVFRSNYKLSRGYITAQSIKYTNVKYISSRQSLIVNRKYSTLEISSLEFERISDETLESLTDYFDELVEQADHLVDGDVAYGDGVLTVKFGEPYGTYVINRQSPNKQIWLSSPKSGPKRYDFINDQWIYKHDGKSLHELLNSEIPEIVKIDVDFHNCSYGSIKTAKHKIS